MFSEENNGKNLPIDRVKIRRYKKTIKSAMLKGLTRIPGLSERLD